MSEQYEYSQIKERLHFSKNNNTETLKTREVLREHESDDEDEVVRRISDLEGDD
jgi:hypothetical protein